MDKLVELLFNHPGPAGILLVVAVISVYVGRSLSTRDSNFKLNKVQVAEHEERLKSIHLLIETINMAMVKMVERQDTVTKWIDQHEKQSSERDTKLGQLELVATKLGVFVDVLNKVVDSGGKKNG